MKATATVATWLLLIGVLTGCTTQTRWVGGSGRPFAQDNYVCEQNAWAMHPGYTGFLPAYYRGQVWESCMMANGWRPESSETSTQPSPQPAPTTSSPQKGTTTTCDWGMYWNSVKGQCLKIGEQ
jgi:hypothetical protein